MDKLAFTKGNNKSTDFFSFCVLAAELLSGKFIPKITDVDSLLSRTNPDIPENVPKELRNCLLSGFDEDQKQRGDWSDVILALRKYSRYTYQLGYLRFSFLCRECFGFHQQTRWIFCN